MSPLGLEPRSTPYEGGAKPTQLRALSTFLLPLKNKGRLTGSAPVLKDPQSSVLLLHYNRHDMLIGGKCQDKK